MSDTPEYLTKPWWETELPYEHGAVRVIEDSINEWGDRCTTVEGRLWQPLNAENNTHRITSKNSASLRAIPPRRNDRKGTLDIVEDHPAGPAVWVSEKPGMAGGAPLEGEDLEAVQALWAAHRDFTVKIVEQLAEVGLHKSQANRLLGPHLWQTIVMSSTSWENYFNLRSPRRTEGADAGIALFAEGIQLALEHSEPVYRDSYVEQSEDWTEDQWHLPYVLPEERVTLDLETLKMCAAARTCRVSRLNHDNTTPSVEKDQATYDGLATQRPMHTSPFEHVAYPTNNPTRCNFTGWGQLRHILEDAAGIDSRI